MGDVKDIRDAGKTVGLASAPEPLPLPMCPYMLLVKQGSALVAADGAPRPDEVIGGQCIGVACGAWNREQMFCNRITAPLIIANNIAMLAKAVQAQTMISKCMAEAAGVALPVPAPEGKQH